MLFLSSLRLRWPSRNTLNTHRTILRAPTLFPAEAGLPEDPELVVVKVNFSPWWQEGVRQLAVQPIETRVERRPPAVRVVEGVETWK